MTKRIIQTLFVAGTLMSTMLVGCLKSEIDEYENWRKVNDAYTAAIDLSEYVKVTPEWAPLNSVYIKWHNDRSLTADNLVPMSTSTVITKYELEDINGKKIENSYSRLDSAYVSVPNANILGMWIALTTLHVGDSVTLIVPYESGYGSEVRSGMQPYTNLIFHMKLKGIKAFEKPNS